MKKLSFILLFALSVFNSRAAFRETLNVKYQKQYGWSKYYTVEVTFATGYELNQATRTFNYDMYSVYATIFWGQNQASVIKLNSYLLCGTKATYNCIMNSFELTGYDQDGDYWYICTRDYCY